MDIDQFIVSPDEKKPEPIVDMWATPVHRELKEKLNSLSKEQRRKLHKSTRNIWVYLYEVYSKET